MNKTSPIKEPFFYDTKKGVDHFTKILLEEGQKKLSEKEKQQIHNLGKDMKRAALDHHIRTVQPFDSFNKETYPSRPEVRGRLMEIEKLEKDLAPPKLVNLPIVKNNINNIKPRSRTGNPSGRDYWKETVALNAGNEGERILPKVSPEDRNQLSGTKLWKAMYKGFSPFEKGTWNAEQRKQKLQREKEAAEDKAAVELKPAKMAEEIIENVMPSSSVVREQKSNNYYPGVVSAEDSISNMPVEYAIRPTKHEPGLSESFVKEKMAEAKIIKDVLGE